MSKQHVVVRHGGSKRELRAFDSFTISSGGTSSGLVVGAGETLLVATGGVAIDTTVLARGTIEDFGVDSGTVLSGTGATEIVEGRTDYTAGESVSAVVSSGGVQSLTGGEAVSTTVFAGGVQYVASYSVASSTTLSGGIQDVTAGDALGTVVDAGGVERLNGAAVTGELTTVNSGGLLDVAGSAVADRAVINSGGLLTVDIFGAEAFSATIMSGADARIFGGAADYSVVESGGVISFENSFASGSFGVIYNGGLQVVDGGSVYETTLSGGEEIVYDGVSADTVIESGGYQLLTGEFGGSPVAIGAVVDRGGSQTVTDNGSAFDTTLNGGDQILSGRFVSAVNTTILSGGDQQVLRDSLASNTIILAGGEQHVVGGDLYYLTAGTAVDTQIYAGGSQFVSGIYQGPGVVIGTTIFSGGVSEIFGSATARDTTLFGGGIEDVLSGGTAGATTVYSGGLIEAAASARIVNTHLLGGGEIALLDLGYSADATASLDAATDVLTVTTDSGQVELQLAGSYEGFSFAVSAFSEPGGDGTLVEAVACYCRGTRILTDAGEVAVEELRIGDRLVTASGAARALRWIGRRSYDGRFAAGNCDVLPVMFAAGALGEGLPRRDLWVSPLHAMYLDGVLIPAACLVNGDTVVQMREVELVEYFHLELDEHCVVFAEGAASESYVEDGNRGMFHNAAEHAARYPAAVRTVARYCAPRVEDGVVVERVRRQLACGVDAALPALRGCIERVERGRVVGWAQSGGAGRLRLRIVDHGVTVAGICADLPRCDVNEAAGGDAFCGFDVTIEGGLMAGRTPRVSVVRAADGVVLAQSGWAGCRAGSEWRRA